MPNWPAAKAMDIVVGVDVHNVTPIPGIPVHPYVGAIWLWTDPTFPKMDVFINGMPAMTVGSTGYSFHVPQGVPVAPTPANTPYWKRYRSNIAMSVVLMALTTLSNFAIAGMAAAIPGDGKTVEPFIKDVTGIDTSTTAKTWETTKKAFSAYVKWQTWVKLLMPPLPYSFSQGSCAVGSPNVQVNGGALAFVAPLVATSCSDIPIVPNANTLGFSNVLVGVSFAQLIHGITVATAQAAISTGLKKGVEKARKRAAAKPCT